MFPVHGAFNFVVDSVVLWVEAVYCGTVCERNNTVSFDYFLQASLHKESQYCAISCGERTMVMNMKFCTIRLNQLGGQASIDSGNDNIFTMDYKVHVKGIFMFSHHCSVANNMNVKANVETSQLGGQAGPGRGRRRRRRRRRRQQCWCR